MGQLKQIVTGVDHTLHLTRDGFVYSFGEGDYSVAGQGGSRKTQTPMILKQLTDQRVTQVACGEYHSLVLTDKHDVYAWGRGYEGQLGISNHISIASTPQYVKSFFGNEVNYIACGAYYSLAITQERKLYGWGEARMGQLGVGKTRMIKLPTHIPVKESEETISRKSSSQVSVREEEPKGDMEEVQIVKCAAGLGHTCAISSEGELFVWGFNVVGQLGLGDKVSRWQPQRVERDLVGNLLP